MASAAGDAGGIGYCTGSLFDGCYGVGNLSPEAGTYALLAFIGVCFLSLTNGHPQLEIRYLVNPLLAMALLGGIFAVDLAQQAYPRMGTRLDLSAAGVATLLILVPSLIRDVGFSRLLRQTDTRTIARQWMVELFRPRLRSS